MCYCIVFALFYFEFEGNFEYMPSGACIWRGELSEGFCVTSLGGLIFGGAYFRNFTRARNRVPYEDNLVNYPFQKFWL